MFLVFLVAGTAVFAVDPVRPATGGFELEKNVIVVKASIDGSRPLEMALDSGTVRTTLDETVARGLGLDLSRKALSSGANGTQEISVIPDRTLQINGVEVKEPLVISYPLDFLAKALGRRVDGIIGIELFRKHIVVIDYAARKLEICPPESYAASGKGVAVALTYDRSLPLVSGFVKPFGREAIPMKFQVDTGGSGVSVDLYKAFVEKHDLESGMRDVRDGSAVVFTGKTAAKEGRVESVQIGSIVVNEPQVRLHRFQYGDPAIFSGNLGSGFLKQFRLTFDLPHDRLIFERQ
jgi:predicted aspartyl protease